MFQIRREFENGPLFPQSICVEGIPKLLLIFLQLPARFLNAALQSFPHIVAVVTEGAQNVAFCKLTLLSFHDQQLRNSLHCAHVVVLLGSLRLDSLKRLLNLNFRVDVF